MPAHKAPRWTVEEIKILRDLFPGGGIRAAEPALPRRSYQSINVMASKLGITFGRLSDAPKGKLQGGPLEQAIRLRERDGWSFERIGLHFGISESAACNAVLIALCPRKGFTPAQRDQHGRLLPEGLERLRLALRRGIKPIDIQLRLGLSAARISEERRRYARVLKAANKVPLPAPGAGEAYSGRKIPRDVSRQVEAMLMQGYGSTRITRALPVSNTHIGRIRLRLIKRLARKSECLPGCDTKGVRRFQIDHPSRLDPANADACRAKLLEGLSIVRAAEAAGVGQSTAFRIRRDLKVELAAQGRTFPRARPVCGPRIRPTASASPTAPTAGRSRTFEEQLAAVRAGARLAPVQRIHRAETITIGGSSLA